ncbi:hypothetical protein OG819_00005, partial [Streptomyces sp. NBC_01549]|nr:hypothetical protein [Streptomyces sp. NBC_01549]
MATAHADRLTQNLAAGRPPWGMATLKNSLTRTALLMEEGDVGVVERAWDRLIDLIEQAILSRDFEALANSDTLRAYKLKLIRADLYSKEPVLRTGGVSARWWSRSPLQKAPLDAGRVLVPNWPKAVARDVLWYDPGKDVLSPALWRGDRVYLVAADHDVALGRVSLRASGHDYWLTREEFGDVVAGDPLLASADTVVLAGHHTATDFLADQIAARTGRTVYGFTGSLSQKVRDGRTFLAPIQRIRTSLMAGTWARYKPGHQTEQGIRRAAQRLGSYVMEPLTDDSGEVFGYASEEDIWNDQNHERLIAGLRDVWIKSGGGARFEFSGRVPWDPVNSYFISMHGSGRRGVVAVHQKSGRDILMNGTDLARDVLLHLPGLTSVRANQLVLVVCHAGEAAGTPPDPLRNVAPAQGVINVLKDHFA